MLGQRPDRELVQQLQERAGLRGALRHPRRHEGRRLRVHRGVLQPQASAFHPRLHFPGGVSEGLDQHSGGRKTGRMNPCPWKTKNRGNLTCADANGMVLISKDSDFRDSHFLNGTPARLLRVTLGNLSNTALLALFRGALGCVGPGPRRKPPLRRVGQRGCHRLRDNSLSV
ncbi:hypothetical protein THIOKS11320125 [Thiocapsa sp. KS1]|nr:hypothetical protein THIOKS11320125 [Thiocapsa sp. KS1]